ncbi:Mitochondrial DNA polymerase catalytic subunit [Aphelenchoides bicaudatus]|nr:Mitochondrial DNA polymerase catalytic subunit [Aphelenchoides bicaudatus]
MDMSAVYLFLEQMQKYRHVGILDKSLSRGKNEINLSTFALLFSEIVKYALNKANSVQELQDKLSQYGKFVGTRLLDVIVLREKSYKRDIKLLNALMFVRGTLWKNLFNKEADKLERSNDDPCKFILIEKEPLVNTFISLPKDKSSLNCAAFTAGIIEAFLTGSNFPCKVSVHWHLGTAYVIEFDEAIMRSPTCYALRLRYKVLPLCRRFASVQANQSQETSSLDIEPIKLIPRRFHEQIFGGKIPDNYLEDVKVAERISKLQIPTLRSTNSIFEHFQRIGHEQFRPYQELLEAAIKVSENMPMKPPKWQLKVGWTKYNADGTFEEVEAPDENVLFFDVEVCTKDGQLPTFAVALSPTNWYMWCSDRFVNLTPVPTYPRLNHLIPLECAGKSHLPKIVIGHNIGYDRAKVREQYILQESATRFWDTMSMNTAVYGMADHQNTLYEMKDADHREPWVNQWRRKVCKNALVDVYNKLVASETGNYLDKALQSVFTTTTIDLLQVDFQRLADYCANDVEATCEVFSRLYPTFKQRFPSPVTYVGMLIMANVYLPITANWRNFFEKCERDAASVNNVAARALGNIAHTISKEMAVDENYVEDPWMWASDWKFAPGLYNKYPKWFLNIFNAKKTCLKNPEELTREDIKPKTRDIPRLFGLCYGPYPLFFKRDQGWGFIGLPGDCSNIDDYETVMMRQLGEVKMPVRKIIDLINENKKNEFPDVPFSVSADGNVGPLPFYKLPHPKGTGANVGSPFSKDFASFYVDKILRATRFQDQLDHFLDSGSNTRFWGNYRQVSKFTMKDRYNEQVTVWLDEEAQNGAIAPAIVPAGTITRRASHKLWLTSTNAKDGMLGSELKSMIECPGGLETCWC